MIDFLFIEFFIRKKYDISVEDYFTISKMSVSSWRTSNNIPPKRLIEFYEKEGSIDSIELFKKIY